jgi:hypothetical protein
MARISDIQRYNKGRKDLTRDNADFETLRFKNENGDVMVIKPQEVREVLHDFIDSEIGFLGDAMKTQIKERLEFKIKQVERTLIEHLDDKINKIAESILEKTIDRIAEEEINRRVLEKIKKCL